MAVRKLSFCVVKNPKSVTLFTMHIRKITKADIPAIRALTKELAEHEKFESFDVPESYFEKNFLGENKYADVYAMDIDGDVVGMGHTIKLANTYMGSYEIFLRDFIVTKEHRGQGYGREFIKFVCQLAKDTDCKKIHWTVFSWNEEALNLYSKISDVEYATASCSINETKIEDILNS